MLLNVLKNGTILELSHESPFNDFTASSKGIKNCHDSNKIKILSFSLEINNEIDFNSCFGIYGLVRYKNADYLIFVLDARVVGEINNKEIFEVSAIKCVCVNKANNDNIFVNEIERFFKNTPGFYFSDYNLHERYNLIKNKVTDEIDRETVKKADENIYKKLNISDDEISLVNNFNSKISSKNENINYFLFNSVPRENYIKKYDSSLFLLNVIQGSFAKFNDLILISRRSPERTGMRYLSRGADLTGNSSNFVETELIFENKNTFIILRGSIPLIWEQGLSYNKINPPITVKLPIDDASNSLLLHHNKINCLYKLSGEASAKIIYFNLTRTTGYEGEITRIYNEEVKKLGFTFYHFDLIENMGRINESNSIISSLSAIQPSTVERKQSIFIRINCIDCLDRTNAMQYLIMKEIVKLHYLIDQEGIKSCFDKNFKRIWLQNGNNLSLQYSGTPALHSAVIKGETGIKGVFIDGYYSIIRYFINRLGDIQVNEIYKLLTRENHDVVIRRKREYYGITMKNLIKLVILIFFIINVKKTDTINNKPEIKEENDILESEFIETELFENESEIKENDFYEIQKQGENNKNIWGQTFIVTLLAIMVGIRIIFSY
ncbi:hypothetical protein NUSPORA_00922 [Nucleospora cyclopteri]